jgi:hypothetical protein
MPKRTAALLAAAAALAAAAGSGAAGSATGGAASTRTIATVTSAELRAELVATKTGAGSAPTARVTVVSSVREHSAWRRTATRRLAGTFFWNTVVGPHALCRLELTTSGRPRLVVRLLLSPSLGCARPQTVPLQDG